MTDRRPSEGQASESPASEFQASAEPGVPGSQRFSAGGLRFEVSFRSAGATLRVEGEVDGTWKELLRFDDFVDMPHYHAPADGEQINFDRALGDPLEWYLAQIRDELPQLLVRSGFAGVAQAIDMRSIVGELDAIRSAMHACVPDGFVRVPGIGLQHLTPAG